MTTNHKGILLHIGLPKTGTTTIQQSLFEKHRDIFYLGKFIKNDTPRGCADNTIYQLLNPLIWDIAKPFDVEKQQAIFNNDVLPKIADNQAIIGSWEGLGNAPPNTHIERINRLKSVFGQCRIIITLRNPLTQIPSEYLQNTRGNFIKRHIRWMGTTPYLEIEEWLNRKSQLQTTLENVFAYGLNIKSSVNMLGKENVGVFAFEDLVNNPQKYYTDICNFIGIDAEQGYALTQEKHLHQRITEGHVNYLKKLNQSPWHKFLHTAKGEKYRRKMFKKQQAGNPAKAELPPEWQQKIIEATKSSHQWLVENYQLPLAEYNYPL